MFKTLLGPTTQWTANGRTSAALKDLGETVVIAHAVVATASGQSVIVLMDDGPGARIANSEMHRLRRIGAGGRPVGAISLANTLTVLKRAAGTERLPDRASMRDTYKRLRCLDDGLLPIEKTRAPVCRAAALSAPRPTSATTTGT